MRNIYEHLTEMLGKSPSDSCFADFVKELGETPELLIETKSKSVLSFPGTGIFLTMDNRQDQIKSIFFHLSTAAVKSGSIKKYSGNLPAGIYPANNRLTVQKKLAIEPTVKRIQGRTEADPKDYWDHFDIGPLELTFIFDGGTEEMHALSVHYMIDTVPPEPPPPEPETYMQQRCNKSALKAILMAQEESRRLKHNFVGSEMLLLGVLGDRQSSAAMTLASAGVSIEKARKEVEKIIGRGKSPVGKNIPFTYGAKRVLELALKEAGKLASDQMTSEHLLLGIMEWGEGVGIRVFFFKNLQVDTEDLRDELILGMTKTIECD